jgi:hypothetical protein
MFPDVADPNAVIAFVRASPLLQTLSCRIWPMAPTSPPHEKETWVKVQKVAEECGIVFGCEWYNDFDKSRWLIGSMDAEDASWTCHDGL